MRSGIIFLLCSLWCGLVTSGPGTMSGHMLHDDKHGVKMGIPWTVCDDGVHDISVDWEPNSEEEISCHYLERIALSGRSRTRDTGNHGNLGHRKYIDITEKPAKTAMHVCLNESIHYNTSLPLSGDHRPLWPKFGSYEYLPPQRWVHALEHGAVVMLYHPCIDSRQLKNLVHLVRGCLHKHTISPYRYIPDNAPVALLAYCHARLLQSYDNSPSDQHIVTSFIKTYALKGPESHVLGDGQYSAGLLKSADVVSDLADSVLCPRST